MELENSQRPLLDPYRTMGVFVKGTVVLSKSNPPMLTAPTGTSFKVYSDTLSMKVVSPPLGSQVTYACSYNEFTYVRIQDFVLKMKYHHVVKRWSVAGSGENCTFLCFQKLIILAQASSLTLIDEQTGSISHQDVPFVIKGMTHPVTYINKLLVYSEKEVILVNAIAGKILYEYTKLQEIIKEGQCQIVSIEASPLVDIAGVSLSNGTIAFLNLKKDQTIFTVRQKLPAVSVTFSSQASWMATGDTNGNVILWDLEMKRILYKFQKCFEGPVDSLVFMPGVPVLTCSSSACNQIKQLRINPDDSKILTLLRQRVGCIDDLQKIKVSSNNQLILSTKNTSMFMAFHSQCNNYLIPKVLDSKLPYHLIAKNFNVELWKQRTVQKTYKLHEYALHGRISLSGRYFVVVTAKRVVKLGGSYELDWKIPAVKDIYLYNQHSIFAFTQFELIICDFNTSTILTRIPKKNITAPSLNVFGNLLTFSSPQEKTIEVWDMNKVTPGRIFNTEGRRQVLCLSFTADNRYLLSSHAGGALLIWSIVEGEIYKQFSLDNDLIAHCFTPDNQFLLSLFKEDKELCVWNNYLGKLSSSRQTEQLHFTPQVRQVNEDYRKELAMLQNKKVEELQHTQTDVFDDIPDAEDDIPEYTFTDITQWMPLVFYDQIKARNTPQTASEAHSLPFFLDFRNLTEQKKKIEDEIRKEALQKKKDYLSQKDKHLKSESNEIILTRESNESEHLQTFKKLSNLSVAQVDYQLRSFLMTPNNGAILIKMMVETLKDKSSDIRQQIKNIITNRVINLIGSELLTSECVPISEQLADLVRIHQREVRERVSRCISIADHHIK